MRGFLQRVAMLALVAPFALCTTHRRVVTLPGFELHVTDAEGAPVAGADVVVVWRSRPHSRIHRVHRFTTDAAGMLTTSEASQDERIAPLCMHGVPDHFYVLCAGKAGHGSRTIEIEPHGASPVTIALPGGEYASDCHAAYPMGAGETPAPAH